MLLRFFLVFFFFFMREVSHVWKMPEVLRRKIKCPPQQHKSCSLNMFCLCLCIYLMLEHRKDKGIAPPKIYIYIYLCFIDYAKAFNCVDLSKLWKILKEMEIPDHLTYLLRNLYACQEATIKTGHGTTDRFQISKGILQGCIKSPCLFNLSAEYIIQNANQVKHKLESRLLGEISIISVM